MQQHFILKWNIKESECNSHSSDSRWRLSVNFEWGHVSSSESEEMSLTHKTNICCRCFSLTLVYLQMSDQRSDLWGVLFVTPADFVSESLNFIYIKVAVSCFIRQVGPAPPRPPRPPSCELCSRCFVSDCFLTFDPSSLADWTDLVSECQIINT